MLDRQQDVDVFWDALRAAAERVLITDYDGVIAPFHVDPASAVPYPEVPPLLDQINSRPRSSVVIISGRGVDDLVPLLGVRTHPEVWGSHGLQRLLADGSVAGAELTPAERAAVSTVQQAADDRDFHRIEMKPFGAALHWRGLSGAALQDEQERVRGFVDRVLKDVRAGTFVRHDFDGGIELVVAGRNKGTALLEVLRARPGCAAAYLGDDVTDEDAFRAAPPDLLTVLARPEQRPTAARAWLSPPDELIDFLRRWDAVCADEAVAART